MDRSELNIKKRKFGFNKLMIAIIFTAIVVVALFAYLLTHIDSMKSNDTQAKKAPFTLITEKQSSDNDANNFFQTLEHKVQAKKAQNNNNEDHSDNTQKDEEIEKYKALLLQQQKLLAQAQAKQNQSPIETKPKKDERLDGGVLVKLGGESSNKNQSNSDEYSSSGYEDGSIKQYSRTDLNYVLQHGTSIECALKTQVISDYTGFVTCQISRDVYSTNGQTLLIRKGSIASGQQKISLNQGVGSLYITFHDITTPNGLTININSLGTNALGSSSIPAEIQNHWGMRIGGALMLSIIGDTVSTIAQRESNSGDNSSQVSIDNSTNTTQDIASQVLQNTINIKPTGYVNPSQILHILMVRDVNFKSVYDLENQ